MRLSTPYSRVIEGPDYYSYVCMNPGEFDEVLLEYLKEEIGRAASLNPTSHLSIGIGIGSDFPRVIELARKAALRDGANTKDTARELEGRVGDYAMAFPNVRKVNVEVFSCHITKRPICVFGSYT